MQSDEKHGIGDHAEPLGDLRGECGVCDRDSDRNAAAEQNDHRAFAGVAEANDDILAVRAGYDIL